MITLYPVTLNGAQVTVVPLTQDFAAELYAIGQERELWTYVSTSPFVQRDDAERYIDGLLRAQREGGRVPFAVIDNVSGRLAGSTCYLNIEPEHGGLEIGATWYSKEFRRTGVNTATKLLLLQHAFENLQANRVQLQTDSRNERSQNAIARIGAKKEGVLRANKVYPSGYIRDSVVYSVVSKDWPDVRQHLEQLLDNNSTQPKR
ncbi:MAG: GNAT family protein [Oceanicoccus sp.]